MLDAPELPPRTRRLRAVAGAIVATLAALVGVGLAGTNPLLAPEGRIGHWPSLAAATALTCLASLARRGGSGSLGLGSALYPLGFLGFGVVPTAVAAGLARWSAFFGRRLLEGRRPEPPPERRGWVRGLTEGAHACLVGLAAGGLALGLELARVRPAFLLWLITGLFALALSTCLEVAQIAWIRQESLPPLRRLLPSLPLDILGWLGGVLLLGTVREGWALTWALAALFSLLAFEIARQETATDTLSLRLEERIAVARAGAALVAGQTSELDRVAGQIFYECAALVPFSWFHLELQAPGIPPRAWWSGEGSPLAEGHPELPPHPPPLPGIHRRRSWHCLERPLSAEGELLGRIRLWSDPRRVDPRAEEILDALVPQMSASVRAAFLDHAARTDRLTGLPTRRVLEPFLEESFRRARDQGRRLAVAVADLDHFKRINDTYGHGAGDQALVAVARLLGEAIEPPCLVARFGGEEFVIVAPGLTGAELLAQAEELRRQVENLSVAVEGGELELSVSLGVAAYPELPVRRADELLELADQCLLEAKRLGRNLCLRNLGTGRLETASGRILETNASPQKEPPRFFA